MRSKFNSAALLLAGRATCEVVQGAEEVEAAGPAADTKNGRRLPLANGLW